MASMMAIRTRPGQVASTSSSLQAPYLLKISSELRNKIYRLALTTDEIRIDASTFSTRKALVDTSSKLRSETREIFYAENKSTIVLDGTNSESVAGWLRSLGEDAALIRDLHIKVEVGDAWINKILENDFKRRGWWTDLDDGWVQKEAAQQTSRNRDGEAVGKALLGAFDRGLSRQAVTGASMPKYRYGGTRAKIITEYALSLWVQSHCVILRG